MSQVKKFNRSNGFYIILTHWKQDSWVVEKFNAGSTGLNPERLYAKTHGSEAEAEVDYTRQVAIVAAEAMMNDEPLSTMELRQ